MAHEKGIDCKSATRSPNPSMLRMLLRQHPRNANNYPRPVPDPFGLFIVHRLAGKYVKRVGHGQFAEPCSVMRTLHRQYSGAFFHVIPLALGGHPRKLDNPELQPWDEAMRKDRIEVKLHCLVCSGQVSLTDAQREIDASGLWIR